jgi:hypothetical protein
VTALLSRPHRRAVLPLPTYGKPSGRRPHSGGTLTTGQVAIVLGVAPRTVNLWADGGKIQHYRLPPTVGRGKGDRRYRPADVVAFCRRHGIPVPDGLGVVAVVGRAPIASLGWPTLAAADWVALSLSLGGRCVVAWVVDYSAGRGDCDRGVAMIRGADAMVPIVRLLPEDVTPAAVTGCRDFRRPFDVDDVAAWLAATLGHGG